MNRQKKRFSELENRTIEKIKSGKLKKEKKRLEISGQSLRDMLRHYQVDQLSPVRVPERKERGKGKERLFEEIMAQNLQILARDMKIHIQESP